MPQEILEDLIAREVGDERHSGTALTITAGLGCPRRVAIERFLPVWPDPDVLWKMHGGSILHAHFAKVLAGKRGWHTEHNGGRVGCEVTLRIFGYEMTALLDAYHTREDGAIDIIRDYKTSFNGADQWVADDRHAEPHHEVQLNLQRIGCEQMGWPVAEDVVMEAWVVSRTMKRTVAARRDELALGLVPVGITKYHGTHRSWTVRELFDILVECFDKVTAAAGDEAKVREVISAMPKVGLDMWIANPRKGTTGCDSCPVQRECQHLDGIL